mgnify:CR=1 FL=1|tara:strand:+ start:1374 stop:3023 length:1650 start_codon:yes stop_codon:yes gene_type:complete
MSLIKSIYFYFLAWKINLNNFFKRLYFSTELYNKSLRTFIPSKIIFFPNAFLLSSFTNNKNFHFQISKIDTNLFWEKSKNSKERKKLSNFLWLSLLDRKVDNSLVRNIIQNWIKKNSKYNKIEWDNSNLSMRIISWILNSEIILSNCSFDFKRDFFESIIIQVNHLKKNLNSEKDYSKKIEIVSAILLSGLVFKEYSENYHLGVREIDKIIDIFFDKNGFPLSRNLEDLLKFIKFFIIIKESVKDAQKLSLSGLDLILEKNLLCFYAFLTPLNKLPLFNGCTDLDLKEFIDYLSSFNIKNKKNNMQCLGGFHILKNKKDQIYFDAGPVPQKNFSNKYQSGPLSFEYFNDKDKIITNCGFGINISKKAALLSKLTSAQSTLSLNNTSVVKFERNHFINKAFGYSSKEEFKIFNDKHLSNDEEIISFASHNAYLNNFGFLHKRQIKIRKKGDNVVGLDHLFNKKKSTTTLYDIYFHLTPGLDAVKTIGGESVLIKVNKNKSMIFFVEKENFTIEKSIFLGGNKILNNLCIKISGKIDSDEKIINWGIKKNI